MAEHSTYEEQAAPMRAAALERSPQPMLEEQRKMIETLEATSVQAALDVGDSAPDFRLQAAGDGATHSLAEALKSGPAVLSFYRGQW